MDPATAWRGPGYSGPPSPAPWPSRVEAFLSACAIHSGQRERDGVVLMEALGKALGGEDNKPGWS